MAVLSILLKNYGVHLGSSLGAEGMRVQGEVRDQIIAFLGITNQVNNGIVMLTTILLQSLSK